MTNIASTDGYRPAFNAALRAGVSGLVLGMIAVSSPAAAAGIGQADTSAIPQTTGQAATTAGDQSSDQPGGEEIVVTGRRAALEAADERKRRSETIIDSVVADDAGKLPDNSHHRSAAARLGRVDRALRRARRSRSLLGPGFGRAGARADRRRLAPQRPRDLQRQQRPRDPVERRHPRTDGGGRRLQGVHRRPDRGRHRRPDRPAHQDAVRLQRQVPRRRHRRTRPWRHGEQGRSVASVLVDQDSFDTPIGRSACSPTSRTASSARCRSSSAPSPISRRTSAAQDHYIPGGFTYGDEAFQYRRYGIYGAAQWAPSDDLTFTGTFFQSRYKSQSSDYGAQVSRRRWRSIRRAAASTAMAC